MEEITDAVGKLNISDPHKKNRIQVSNTKKPIFFYVNLAKVFRKTLLSEKFLFWFLFLTVSGFCLQRYMQQHNEVELSALGMGTYPSFLSRLNAVCFSGFL